MANINTDKHYAIVIGIEHYPFLKNGKFNIPAAHEDAKAVFNWLSDKENGGGLDPKNIYEIILSVHEGKLVSPNQDIIDEAFIWLANIDNEKKERLYFYFSGHGLANTGNDVQLCMAPWDDFVRVDYTISAQLYSNGFSTAGFCQRFFWLDCCRTKYISSTTNGPKPKIGDLYQQSTDAGWFHAYAAEYEKSSYFPKKGISFFTQALLEGLKGGVTNESGDVTCKDLKNFLERRTSELANKENRDQTAQVETTFSEKSIIVHKNNKNQTQKVRLDLSNFSEHLFLKDSTIDSDVIDIINTDELFEVELFLIDYELLDSDDNLVGVVSVYPSEDFLEIKVSRINEVIP